MTTSSTSLPTCRPQVPDRAARGRSRRAALLLLVALTMPLSARAVAAPPGAWWWHRPAVRQELGLTSDQVRTLDRIYLHSLPGRRVLRRRLESLERRFALVLRVGVDQPRSTRALVDSLTEARRRSNVARTMMLVRMIGVLEAGQRSRLAQIAAREGI